MMDNKISLRVDLETLSARNELERFKRAVSSFASDTRSLATGLQLNVNASFDDAAARTGIQALRSSLQNSLRIDIGTTQALSELERLKRSVLSFISDTRSLTTGLQLNVNASFDDAAARASIQSFRDSLQSQTVRIRIDVDGAGTASAIQQVRTSVVALTAATAIALPILRDYNDELDRIRTNADTAADAIRRAAEQQERLRRAGGGGGGNGADQRSHTLAVIAMAQAYSGLASKLLIAKSAMAVLTATAAGAAPVLGQMAATVGMAFGTALATANVAAMSKELQKLAENTGTSAQALQSWRLAARFEGITAGLNELGDVGAVFTDLSEKMDKLGTKDGEDFAKALKAIGLNASEIKAAKPEEALLKIGDALSKIKMSDRDKSAFLSYISKDAANLLPLLQQNAQKFQEIQQYANAVGAIQSDAQLAAMKQTNTELSYFKVGLEGVQTQLAAVGSNVINTLGPNIRQLFIDARAPLQAWSTEVNTTLTKFKADLDSGGWGAAFSNMFQSAYPTLHQFVSSAAEFGRGYGQAFVAPMLTELKAAYAGISSSLAGAGGAEALGRGMGEAMQPVIAIVHNVVGAVKLLIDNWSTLKEVASYTPVGFVVANWDKVVSVFTSVGNGIRSVAETFGILNPATTTSASGVQVFLAALGGLLAASASTKLALGLVGAAVSTFSFALGPLGSALGVVTTAIKIMSAAAIANPIGATIAVIAAGAALLYANWDKVSGWWSGLWGGLQAKASGFASWWQGTTFDQKLLDVKDLPLKAANAAATSFFKWWDNSELKKKSPPIVVAALNEARGNIASFFAWWHFTDLSEKYADIKTATITYADQKAKEFKSWWNSWTLREVTADVTASLLIGAWDKAKALDAWWHSWNLLPRSGEVNTSLVEKAWNFIKSFATWWEGLSLKSLIPEIKMPDFSGIRAKLSGIGADISNGLADGINRAKAHITAADAAAGGIETAMRARLDTHSPSRIAEAIGADTAAGLGIGIEKGGNIVKSAAEKTAQAATDAFRSIMESTKKQLLSLTVGDEAARRYELSLQGITGANQNAVIAAEAHVKSLEAQKKKTDEAKAASEAAAKAYKDLSTNLQQQIIALTQGDEAARRFALGQQQIVGANQDAIIKTEAYIKSLEAQKQKTDEARAASEAAQKAIKESSQLLEIAKKSLFLNDEALQALTLSYKAGYTPALAQAQAAMEQQTKTLQSYRTEMAGLVDKTAILAASLRGGEAAARAAELGLKGYNLEQIASIQSAEALNKKLSETIELASGIGDAIAKGLFSGDWKSAGQSILGDLKATFIDPLKQDLSDAIKSALTGNGSAGGGLLGGLTDKIKGIFSGISSSVSGLFGGGALGGVMGAAAPLALVAGITSMLKGMFAKDGNIVFGQNMQQGQQLSGQGGHAGQEHYRQSIFGLLGATLDSNKIGREKDFVPKFHVMMDQMVALDKMIATAIPASIGNIKAALQGVTQSGFSTSDMLKSRYTAVFSALPEELQKAMQGGKNLMAGTAEEIVARFGLMAAAAQSVVPALDQLGVNTGKTRESAIAAALGLTDLMGGIDKVKESAAFYYQEFFSEEERKAQALRKASADVAAFNQSLGLTGSATINSHAEFRKYIESLDLTTEAGRKAYAAAMAVAGSMDIVADAYKAKVLVLQQALPALENLNLRIGSTGNSALTAVNGLASLMGGIDNLTKAANTYYDQFFSDEEKKKQALANAAADVDRFNKTLGLSGKGAIDTHAEFKKYIESLDLQTEAGRKAYAEAMKIVGSMDALADTGKSLDDVIGSLPKKLYAKALAMAGLSDAVDKAATGSTDALNDVKRTMTGLGTAAGKTALAIEEFVNKALKAARLLNAANPTTGKNNNGGVDGSHASGLGYVPKDGYIAELHKGEMVLTANQAALYRMGSGGNQMAVSVRPQLSIVVNNNTSSKVSVKESTDAAGNTNAVMTIEDIETAIADRARRGKGLAGTFATVGRR